jgi:hypothetical protein
MSDTTELTRPKKPAERHSRKRIDEGLLALLRTGSSYQASELTGISDATLRYWRLKYADRMSELAKRHGPQLEQEAIQALQEAAAAATQGTLEAVDAARQEIRNGTTKDAAATARNLATVVGITTEKALLLQGKPTSVTEHAGTRDVLTALARRIPGLVIDSTATEIPEATQLPSNTQGTTTNPPLTNEGQPAKARVVPASVVGANPPG